MKRDLLCILLLLCGIYAVFLIMKGSGYNAAYYGVDDFADIGDIYSNYGFGGFGY